MWTALHMFGLLQSRGSRGATKGTHVPEAEEQHHDAISAGKAEDLRLQLPEESMLQEVLFLLFIREAVLS